MTMTDVFWVNVYLIQSIKKTEYISCGRHLFFCYDGFKKKGGDNLRLIFKILIVVGIILAAPLAVALSGKTGQRRSGLLLPCHFGLTGSCSTGRCISSGAGLLSNLVSHSLPCRPPLPRPRSLYLHQKADGQVTVSKKAIENFTLSALRQEPYIGNPKVSAKLSRNKIKLNISGDLMNSVNAKQHTADFLNQLESDLRTCLGIAKEKRIAIRLVNFNAAKSNSNQPRVV